MYNVLSQLTSKEQMLSFSVSCKRSRKEISLLDQKSYLKVDWLRKSYEKNIEGIVINRTRLHSSQYSQRIHIWKSRTIICDTCISLKPVLLQGEQKGPNVMTNLKKRPSERSCWESQHQCLLYQENWKKLVDSWINIIKLRRVSIFQISIFSEEKIYHPY